MRPALIVLTDDPAAGAPGLTDEPDAADGLLAATLDLARQVGGVGRVLLFHPPEAESALMAKALGFRLWPQDGADAGQRYANAFRQAGDLGYEGALVVGLDVPNLEPDRLTDAAAMLEEHQGVVAPNGRGGIAFLGLQRPEPTLLAGADVPTYDELRTRAKQQLVRLVELDSHAALDAGSVGDFLAKTGR